MMTVARPHGILATVYRNENTRARAGEWFHVDLKGSGLVRCVRHPFAVRTEAGGPFGKRRVYERLGGGITLELTHPYVRQARRTSPIEKCVSVGRDDTLPCVDPWARN